jgi:CelD/BcsL family acetyltransferase involved in cellulose biosynthesis
MECLTHISPAPALDALQTEWRELESRTDLSFFQSWAWMGAWLRTLPADLEPLICRTFLGERLVGLAAFIRRRTTSLRFLPARVALLSQTGSDAQDAITIEHNGIACATEHESACLTSILNNLLAGRSPLDEVIASGLTDERATLYQAVAQRMGAVSRVAARRPYFYVNLAAVRERSLDYLDALSSNTRYQIRRAMRAYEQRGALRCTAAGSVDEACDFFEHMGVLHQKYWVERGRPGAFANAYFVRFHRRLIRDEFAGGHVQILRIDAGSHVIGYLYNLVHEGVVSSYQSGLEYEADAKLKPGLVCHTLAIAHNMKAGGRIYDLLAGDSQYKRSLATDEGGMTWLRICRPRLALHVEDAMRRLAANPLIRRVAGRPVP